MNRNRCMSRRTAWLSDNPLHSTGDGLPVSKEESRPLLHKGNAKSPSRAAAVGAGTCKAQQGQHCGSGFRLEDTWMQVCGVASRLNGHVL